MDTNNQVDLVNGVDALLTKRLSEPPQPSEKVFKRVTQLVEQVIEEASAKGLLLGDGLRSELGRIEAPEVLSYLELSRCVHYFNYHSAFIDLATTDSNQGRYLVVRINDEGKQMIKELSNA